MFYEKKLVFKVFNTLKFNLFGEKSLFDYRLSKITKKRIERVYKLTLSSLNNNILF